MIDVVEAVRRRDGLRILAALGLCLLIWVWRRPEQLTRPYVWVEESVIIRNFVEDGWAGGFEPIQGYLVLPANLFVSLSTAMSFTKLPELMYVFALAIFVATVLLLLIPESRWGNLTTRSLMAVSMALVPTNPEVFGVLLYSLWWTTLWPLIILGWRRDLWLLRVPLLLVGALSSPAGGALFVVFALAFVLNRRMRDLVSAAVLLAGFVVQLVIALDSTRAELLSKEADPRDVVEQTLRTAGMFETRWLAPFNLDANFLQLAGVVFIAFLLVAALRLSFLARRHDVLLLTVGAGVFTVLSAAPAPLITDPAGGGPRYYFLPFVVFAWVLIALWRYADLPRLRTVSALLLCLSFLGLATTFSRGAQATTANLSWEEEVQRCAASTVPVHQIPIYFDGTNTTFWFLGLRPSECRRRLAGTYSSSG